MEKKKLVKKERYGLKKAEQEEARYAVNRQKKAKIFLFWGIVLTVIGALFWIVMLKLVLLRLPL